MERLKGNGEFASPYDTRRLNQSQAISKMDGFKSMDMESDSQINVMKVESGDLTGSLGASAITGKIELNLQKPVTNKFHPEPKGKEIKTAAGLINKGSDDESS